MSFIKSQKGIGLVEVIFALGVSVLVITSLVSLSLFTLRSSTRSKLLLQGTKLANQELEKVRALRDAVAQDAARNWEDNFIGLLRTCSVGNPCTVNDDFASLAGSRTVTVGSQVITIYFYATKTDDTAIAVDEVPDVVKISVVAAWSEGGQARSVYNYTNLSNWRRN